METESIMLLVCCPVGIGGEWSASESQPEMGQIPANETHLANWRMLDIMRDSKQIA